MKKIHASIIYQGPLTTKEGVVLRYLCEGYLQKQIALKIFRTQSTVGKHLESISKKLDCHCAAEIVSTAIAMGLVKVEIRQKHHITVKCLIIAIVLNSTSGNIKLRPPRTARTTQVTRTQSRYS